MAPKSEMKTVRINLNIPLSPTTQRSADNSANFNQRCDGGDETELEYVETENRSSFKETREKLDSNLGQWGFEKKKKKKYYMSMTGRLLYGADAANACKVEKRWKDKGPSNLRNELGRLAALQIPERTEIGSVQFKLSGLDMWGIPLGLVTKYECKGVTNLFQWQIDCLQTQNNAALIGGNLVYSAPTSGGKTLVAEILMMRRLGTRAGTIFFVVPFVALVEEKTEYFRDVWSDLRVSIKGFHGGDSESSLPPDLDVAVCTIERANILVNSLLAEKREEQLSMIVVDEIHMLSDSHRGFLLEVLLSKVLFLFKSKVQCIGMSATLPNIDHLATWLHAALFTTECRPVELSLRVLANRMLYRFDEKDSNQFVVERLIPSFATTDVDGIEAMCLETMINDSKSVLMFCQSKDLCQNSAKRMAAAVKEHSIRNNEPISAILSASRELLLMELWHTEVGLCPVLRNTIPYGTAYHHSGLSSEERLIIEKGFRTGALSLLCATTTLSAGVNLPAHRVIIRSPYLGIDNGRKKVLSIAGFKQMCGRAGRFGLDLHGEAILVLPNASKAEMDVATALFTSPIEPLRSVLHQANGGGIEKLLLELISCGKLQNEAQIHAFMEYSLLKVQHPAEEVHRWTTDAASFLKLNDFTLKTSDGSLLSSQLALATVWSGISPIDVISLYPSLESARDCLVMSTFFHAVFLVTPPSTNVVPNWSIYETVVSALYQDFPEVTAVAELLGIEHADLVNFARNPPVYGSSSLKVKLYRRFYSAIILFRLVSEQPVASVSQLMSVERGQAQSLQKEAGIFCGMVISFCERLNWNLLSACFRALSNRLSFCVADELIPLMRLGSEMCPSRARAFYAAGINSPKQLLRAGIETVTEILVSLVPHRKSDEINNQQDAWKSQVRNSCKYLGTKLLERL